MKKIIVVLVCSVVAALTGLQTFNYAQEGFLQMGINAVSADHFARIIWTISTSLCLTSLLVLNKYIDPD